ncbi:nuclear transport factor 2 family protein [Olivibacter sp. XZL3]|uniref:nuclear transport factor 2 family protein n=1 Tax=Olivibacter sp. XZL3 TaxID=1735116 RepID=UPI001066D403|nr:nuclear transport factor 2 family protein [Olivibacter sp. XZL3]
MLRPKILLLFTMIVSGTLTYGQTAEEKQLLKTVEDLRLAMINGDRNALDAIAADNLNYWHSSGNHEDKATFIESLTSGKSDFVTINLSEQTVTISGEVATVHHILSGETNDGGKPGSVRIGVLLVFQKQGERWKLFARQAFKLPA